MSYWIALLSIFSAVFALFQLTKKPFAILFPLVNLSVITLLYVAGWFGQLRLGAAVIVIGTVLLLLLTLIKAIREQTLHTAHRFFAPFVLLITAFAVLQYVALCGMEVFSWDELTHWGLVVKNMFFQGDFGGGETATTMFKGYPVGTSLYLCFFEIFGTEFAPAHLYMAMNLLNVSLMLPVVARFRSFGKQLLITVITLSAVFPLNVTAYLSIWNDTVMAALFAYILISHFCFRESEYTAFRTLSVCLGSFVLCLAKSTGIAFVLFAYLIIAADQLTRRSHRLHRERHTYLSSALAIASVLCAKLSWSAYQTLHGLGEAWETSRLTPQALLRFFTSPTPFQREITKHFGEEFLFPYTSHGNGNCTPIPYPILILLIAVLVIWLIKRTHDRRYALSLGIALPVCFAFYVLATLVSYLFTFSEGEAYSLASYVRYLNTFIMAAILLLVSLLCATLSDSEKRSPKKLLTASVCALCAVCLLASPVIGSVMQGLKAPYHTLIEQTKRIEPSESIYTVTVGGSGFLQDAPSEYLAMRFLATPIDCSGLRVGGSPYLGDWWERGMTPEQMLETMRAGGYDYLYLHRIDQSFVTEYAKLFVEEPQCFTLYRMQDNGSFAAVD